MSSDAIPIRPLPRAPIRRAAVTGLFALWLAPLQPCPAACTADCRCAEAEAPGRAAEPARSPTTAERA